MNSSDARAERLRRVNRHKAVQAELARQKEEAEFYSRRDARLRSAAADEALAAALAEEQRLETKDEKMLQLVRDFPEVRQLEQLLRDAHLHKSRSEQVSDRDAAKLKEAEEHRAYLAYLNEQDRLAAEEEARKQLEEVERFRRHQADQLEIIKQHRAAAVEEAHERKKERIAVDAVVARVQEKEFLEGLARKEKQRQLQEEHDEFYRIRAELKKAELAREAKEEAAIQAYLQEQARRKEMEDKMAKEKDIVRSRILEEQSRRIAEEQRKKLELENLLHEYYEEERLAKELALMRAERESRERMSAAVTQENLVLVQQRKAARDAELAEEAHERQMMMEQLAAKAKMDQLNKQRQIQLKKEHIAEVNARLEERRQQKEAEKRLERVVDEQDKKREEEIQEYIRRARAQLLAEHLPKLGEFAPVHGLKEEERQQFLPYLKQAKK